MAPGTRIQRAKHVSKPCASTHHARIIAGVSLLTGSPGARTRPRRPDAQTRPRRPRSDPRPRLAHAPSDEFGSGATSSSGVLRYLPIAVATTAVVIVVPALLTIATIPRRGISWELLSAAVAAAGSLALATAGAALWKRGRYSRDVLFSELMLWAWLRRHWAERRLSQQRELFDHARSTGAEVDIEKLLGLSRVLEARNPHVHGHSQRVARHSARVAHALGLPKQQVAKISVAAEVHDVGKLYTPREILNNPRRLTSAEYAVVQEHAACGARMVNGIGDPEITEMVRHHHERIDGHGYPDGLIGPAIPLGARIIAVADTFDAITSKRAYRSARAHKQALDVLEREAGSQLDAEIVAAFVASYSSRRPIVAVAFLGNALLRAPAALQAASVGSIVPAIGAAGALVLAPVAVDRTPRTTAHGGRAADVGRTVASATAHRPSAQAAQPGIVREGAKRGRSPGSRSRAVAHVEHPAPGRAPTRRSSPSAGAAPDRPVANTPTRGAGGGSGGGASPLPSYQPPATTPSEPGVTTPPIQVPVPSPPVPVPSVTVPTVSTPTVPTPGVPTPSVATQ